MSASLLRRGLDLLSEDLKDLEKGKDKKKKKVSEASMMDRISSNRQGVRKQIRRLQTHKRPKNKATVKDKHVKNAIEEYRKKHQESQYNKNLKYFLGSSSKTQSQCTEKILRQNVGRQSRHRPDRPVKKNSEKSVFTEKEFQKFQEEYFSKL